MASKVSVALCTYNGVQYLEEQLLSILGQTVPIAQLVVSDDGSTDGSVELVRRVVADFRRHDPSAPLEFLLLENPSALGVTKNFERAVRACDGDLISLCDQDDRWHVDRIERMLVEFEARPELTLLHSDAGLVDGDGHPFGISLMQALGVTRSEAAEIHSGRAFDALLRRNLVTGATVMFRRELLTDAIPFYRPWVHDEWLAMVASIVGRIDFLPGELIDYRQHGGNQIGAEKLTMRDRIRKLREPRDERNQHLVARAESLLGRLIGLGEVVAPSYVERVKAKLKHDRWRRDLPESRAARLLPVAGAVLRGRYSHFSNGFPDVVRDLLQPA